MANRPEPVQIHLYGVKLNDLEKEDILLALEFLSKDHPYIPSDLQCSESRRLDIIQYFSTLRHAKAIHL